MSASLLTFNPRSFVPTGHTYCCAAIGRGLDARDPAHRTYFLRTKQPPPCRFEIPLPGRALTNLGFRIARDALLRRMEARFHGEAARRAGRGGAASVALLWPGASLALVRRLKAAGVVTAVQMINTHVGYAKAIVDAEYAALGLRNPDPIPDSEILYERALFEAVDVVLAPSEPVIRSLAGLALDPRKVRFAPFGCDPSRFTPAPRPARRVTILFVGSICVRKGAHHLLEAWAASGIDGTLVFCGKMEPAIASRCGALLRRPDVTVLPFTRDVVSVYQNADLFAFPTLEEGAPLVIYEAASMGLPILTTAMGACAIVRDGVSGRILDAHDREGWVAALRQLAASRDLRHAYGEAARVAASTSTWAHAAEARLAGLGAAPGA